MLKPICTNCGADVDVSFDGAMVCYTCDLCDVVWTEDTSPDNGVKYPLLLLTGVAIAIALIFIVFGVYVAQAEDVSDCPWQGDDLTELLYAAYDAVDDREAWLAIQSEMLEHVGQPIRWLGVYSYDDRWVLVSQRTAGYYLQSGNDWTLGDANQLHGVTCAIMVDTLPANLVLVDDNWWHFIHSNRKSTQSTLK